MKFPESFSLQYIPAYLAKASSDLNDEASPSSEMIEVANILEMPGIDLRIEISFS